MGANFDYRVYKDKDINKVKEKWSNDVDNSLHESGHSYSSEIGMMQKIG